MITVIVGGAKVLCFKAFLGWGAFVIAFLANPHTPGPVAGGAVYNASYVTSGIASGLVPIRPLR